MNTNPLTCPSPGKKCFSPARRKRGRGEGALLVMMKIVNPLEEIQNFGGDVLLKPQPSPP